MSSKDISEEEREFLAKCEEEFKDRFTENDEEFMKVFNAEPPKPPILESWWASQNSGKWNDRRHRRGPYDRRPRGHGSRYNDYSRRNHGYQNRRPRYN